MLGLPPSPVCDDATFLRRATIDLAGRLPTRKELDVYLADKNPKKVEKLIDRLLASDDYADYFASKWSAVLRNRRFLAAGGRQADRRLPRLDSRIDPEEQALRPVRPRSADGDGRGDQDAAGRLVPRT